MIKFVEKKLGKKAEEYIKLRLKEGRDLSQCLLKKGTVSGTITTMVPDFISEKELNNFTSGKIYGKYSETSHFADAHGRKMQASKIVNQIEWLISVIGDYLNRDEENAVIFENYLAMKNDGWIKKKPGVDFVYFEKQVYSFLTTRSGGVERIKNTINCSESTWPGLFCVFFKAAKEQLSLKKNQELSFKDLSLIADLVEKIVLGVYDGESYLLWEKNK